MCRKNFKNSADAILEYVLVLGIIAAVFLTMNIYVKRGLQGRLKDMTDVFISHQQLSQVDPTTSWSDRKASQTMINQGLAGGGVKQTVNSPQDVAPQETVVFHSEVEERLPVVSEKAPASPDLYNQSVPYIFPEEDKPSYIDTKVRY